MAHGGQEARFGLGRLLGLGLGCRQGIGLRRASLTSTQ
jgi:hypothetical protein